MQSATISYRSSLIHFLYSGSGRNPIICFHGYGEEALSFEFLEKYLDSNYTLVAIDLPFHGQTNWVEKSSFTIHDLQEIVTKILHQLNAENKMMFIGYSLGGRVALSLYQVMPEQISRLILLAPDGLKVNFWYWLSTQTWAGNKLFRLTMFHPHWFFGFLKLLNGLKLVNASIFKFVNYYINDQKLREQLYNRWTSLRKLKPNLKKIRLIITQKGTQVRLIYGKHDRIILPTRGEKFCRGIERNCHLSVIHSGHQVLNEKHVEEILPALFD